MFTLNYGVRLYSFSHTPRISHQLKNFSIETYVQNGNPFSKLFMTDDLNYVTKVFEWIIRLNSNWKFSYKKDELCFHQITNWKTTNSMLRSNSPILSVHVSKQHPICCALSSSWKIIIKRQLEKPKSIRIINGRTLCWGSRIIFPLIDPFAKVYFVSFYQQIKLI